MAITTKTQTTRARFQPKQTNCTTPYHLQAKQHIVKIIRMHEKKNYLHLISLYMIGICRLLYDNDRIID
jgi:hypothetical protein